MRYLDLSETSIDRKAAEWLAQAVAPPAPPAASVSAAGREPDAGDKSKPKRVRGPWEEEDDSDEEGLHAGEDGSAPRDEVAEAGTEQDAEEAEAMPRKPLFDSAPLLREEWSGEKAAVQSLRLENCGLRGPPLEALGELPEIPKAAHDLTPPDLGSKRVADLECQARLASQEPHQPLGRSCAGDHHARLSPLD